MSFMTGVLNAVLGLFFCSEWWEQVTVSMPMFPCLCFVFFTVLWSSLTCLSSRFSKLHVSRHFLWHRYFTRVLVWVPKLLRCLVKYSLCSALLKLKEHVRIFVMCKPKNLKLSTASNRWPIDGNMKVICSNLSEVNNDFSVLSTFIERLLPY